MLWLPANVTIDFCLIVVNQKTVRLFVQAPELFR
jgi:hypothetical protein